MRVEMVGARDGGAVRLLSLRSCGRDRDLSWMNALVMV